jgi:hypothetical protein
MQQQGASNAMKSKSIVAFVLGAYIVAVAGCGTIGGRSLLAVFVSECDGEPATDLVVLDWSGGASRLYPGGDFPGLDFAAFATTGGGTLVDDAGAFQEAVRGEVVHIFCGMPSVSIAIQNEGGVGAGATRVYLVEAPSQAFVGQIGEGEYDPCNVQRGNSALVFGEALDILGPYSFDEWVTIFANVTAHEIGHTLGFPHVARSDVPVSPHAIFVELMLADHTVSEMLRPQRFLADEANCPDGAARSRRRIDPPAIACGLTE